MSRSSTNSPSCRSTDGCVTSSRSPCIRRPVPNSRWITESCRSRAMRSRSSNSASRRWSSCARATSSASAAWLPKAVAAGRSTSWNGSGPTTSSRASGSDPSATGTTSVATELRPTSAVATSGIGVAHRLGPLEGLGDSRVRAVDPAADQPGRVGTRRRLDHPALAVPGGQGHDRQLGVGDRPGLPRDPVEHLVRAPLRQQRRGDRVRRLQPLLAPPAVAVQAGLLHRDAGRRGQRDDHLLVARGELGRRRPSRPGTGCRTPRRPPAPARRGSCASAGGWAGSRTSCGCRRMSGRRTGSGCAMSSPSTPLPVGWFPIRRCASASSPETMNSASSPPPSSSTPSAP